MTHELASELLTPYLDNALPLGDAAAVRAHLADCAACSADLASLRRVNQALELPPSPPVAFHAFWAGIEKSLPRRRAQGRGRGVRRSLALAVALAALLVLATAASAFASDRILPDSPVYPLKRVAEDVRLELAGSQTARVHLELQLAGERLREARAMARERKTGAALTSLRSFESLLNDATPTLQHPDAADRQDVQQTIGTLTQELGEVEQAATAESNETDVQVEAIVEQAQASLVQDKEQEASQSTIHETGPGTPSQESEPERSAPQPTPEASTPGGATD